MTSLALNLCGSCRRNLGDGRCTAFPDGIPEEIWWGRADHRQRIDMEPTYLPDFEKRDLLEMWETQFQLMGEVALTAAYNPSQLRIPVGHPGGGRWTKGIVADVPLPGLEQVGWAEGIDIQNDSFTRVTSEQQEKVRAALQVAKGKTERIKLDEVILNNPSQMFFSAGGASGGGSVIGQYQRVMSGDQVIGRIRVNTAVFDPKMRESQIIGQAVNWEVPTTKTKDPLTITITHETGHAAFFTLSDGQMGELFDRVQTAVPEVGDLREQAMEGGTFVHGFMVQQNLSKYGSTNINEMVAEGWTEYILNDAPRPLAKAVGSYLEEALGPVDEGLTAAYNPSQPRDERGRWTSRGRWTGMGVSTPAEWASRVDILGATAAQRRKLEKALLTAAGGTSKIGLAEVVVNKPYEMTSSLYGTVVGTYVPEEESLILSTEAFTKHTTECHARDSKGWEQGLNFDVPTTKTQDGLTVTLTHEVGHAALVSLEFEQAQHLFTVMSETMGTAPPKDLSDEELSWWRMANHDLIAKNLSNYAATNWHEVPAEAWTEYILNDNPRPLAKAAGEVMEGYLK